MGSEHTRMEGLRLCDAMRNIEELREMVTSSSVLSQRSIRLRDDNDDDDMQPGNFYKSVVTLEIYPENSVFRAENN
jgi:hypothetical protein